MRIALLLVFAGCVSSNTITCEDGRTCPAGRICDDVHALCVTQKQRDVCAGAPDFADCTTVVVNGRCYDGVCLTGGCGNALADPEERCDDGNTASGDGCAAECNSTEVCRNSVIDIAKGEDCDDGNALNHDGCASTCATEAANWVGLPRFTRRLQSAMTYDGKRGRVVQFGGFLQQGTYRNVFGETWEWDGHAWYPPVPVTAPSSRSNAALAFDSNRNVTVLFGGNDGSSTNDTWEWNGGRWDARTPPASPTPRAGHSLVFVPTSKLSVMFGGTPQPGSFFGDTWTYDGTRWIDLGIPGPTPREAHQMVYDPVRDVVVLHGGIDAGLVPFTDTWELCLKCTPATWTRKTTSGPASANGVMAFDSVNQRVMLVDNSGSPQTWLWDGATWMMAATAPQLADGTASTDPITHHVLAVGPNADTWEWTGSAWTRRDSSDLEMPPRFSATAARDANGRRVFVFGGAVAHPCPPPNQTQRCFDYLADSWSWNGTWTQLAVTNGPAPRLAHAMVYDDDRRELVMVGGTDGSIVPFDETWTSSDGATWVLRTPADAPLPRYALAMIYEPARHEVLLFGGTGSTGGALGDTWTWNGTTWTDVTPADPSQSPLARPRATLGYDPLRQRVVLFGGGDSSSSLFSDTWEWDGQKWTNVTPASSPSPRTGAAFAWDAARKRLVLVGGQNPLLGVRDDTWEWDGTTWHRLQTPRSVTARTAHAVFTSLEGGGVTTLAGFTVDSSTATDSTLVGLVKVEQLQWGSATVDDTCGMGADDDGDALAGCLDLDCWNVCTPECAPGVTCDPTRPHCGDGTCNTAIEDCRVCPADCGACP